MSDPDAAQVIVTVGDEEPRIDSFRLARAELVNQVATASVTGDAVPGSRVERLKTVSRPAP